MLWDSFFSQIQRAIFFLFLLLPPPLRHNQVFLRTFLSFFPFLFDSPLFQPFYSIYISPPNFHYSSSNTLTNWIKRIESPMHPHDIDNYSHNDNFTDNNSRSKYPSNSNSAPKRSHKRRRGRPNKSDTPDADPTLTYEGKIRKISNVAEYQNALRRHRMQDRKFHSPFQTLDLNIQKQNLLQSLKDARDSELNLRVVVRRVGVRHQRNLYKYGVKQQLTYIINYLESGKIPRWMKDHFQQLLQKDFSKCESNEGESNARSVQ